MTVAPGERENSREREETMSRRVKDFFSVVPLMCIDMVLAVVCFAVAYAMRSNVSVFNLGEIVSTEEFRPYLHLLVFAPIIRVFCYSLFGVYERTRRSPRAVQDVFGLFKAICLGSGILIIVTFLYRGVFEFREYSYRRMVFALDWLLNLGMVIGVHTLLQAVLDELKRRGIGVRRVAVQGVGEAARALMSELERFPELGYRVVGFIAHDFDENTISVGNKHFERLGGTQNILHLVNKYKLDEIVVTNVAALGSDLMTFVDECHKRDVVVKLVPDFYGILMQQRNLEELAGQPVVQINEIAIVGFARVIKRMEDIVISVAVLAMTWWILLIVAIAIKCESRGPVLFKQERVGRNGATFTLYKFRSMIHDAEQRRSELDAFNESDGFLFKIKDDPRITKVGRIIRRTSIDELPQLFNVVRGDMSLVGPRPLPATDIEKTGQWNHHRLSVQPGITGMWQVNRKEHTSEEMAKWDIYYIENWSLWLDIKILFKTVGVVLFGKGAY